MEELATDQVGPGGAARTSLHGEIDLARSGEIEGQLVAAEAQGPAILEIDLSSVSFMDSEGLRVLLRANQRAVNEGRRVVIVNPSPVIQRLFDIAGINALLDVVNDGAG